MSMNVNVQHAPSPCIQSRVFFANGQYASVQADNVFDAVADALGIRAMIYSRDVDRVDVDIVKRYLSDPAYV